MSLVQRVLGTDGFDIMVEKLNGAIDCIASFNTNLANLWRQLNSNSNNLVTARNDIRAIQDDIVDVTEAEMTAYVTSLYS